MLSVVLATHDRAPILNTTLGRFRGLATDGLEWELVVADSASNDETPSLLRAWRRDLPLKTVRVEQAGKSRALNRAMTRVAGDLVVFTDDDVIPERRWLLELDRAAARWPGHDVFGGRVKLAAPPGAPDWLFELDAPAVNFARYDPGGPEAPVTELPHGPSFAVRRRALADEGFDERIGPDGTVDYSGGCETELLRRLTADGPAPVYVPSAVVHHIIRPEQLERSRLLLRSATMGRGGALQSHDTDTSVRLFGAPRWMWRSLAEALVGRLLTADPPRLLELELQARGLRAAIAEHRRITAERRRR